ncbi:MAG: hypothetical protein K1X67_10470 [Fimbriimonadaceae bacterium]|nr:hypothetical protein [Fimbriimonadaceae bacterium]
MVYQNAYLQEYWPDEPQNRDMWEDNLELMRAYYAAALEILNRRGCKVQALDISTGPCLAPLLATMACIDDIWLSDFTKSSRKAIQEVPISYWRNYAKYLIDEFALEISEGALLDQLDRLRTSHQVLDVDLARRPVFLPESAEIGSLPLVTMHFVADSIGKEKQLYFEYLATACSYVAERGFLLMSSLTDSQWWMLGGTRQPSPGVTEQEVLSFLESKGFDIISVVRSRIKPQQTYDGGWIVTLVERREEQ